MGAREGRRRPGHVAIAAALVLMVAGGDASSPPRPVTAFPS